MEKFHKCCDSVNNESNSCNNRCTNSICNDIDCLNSELCDMKTNLAAARANLLNLVRIMCICSGIFDEERELLLTIESTFNSFDCNIVSSKNCVRNLNNRLC